MSAQETQAPLGIGALAERSGCNIPTIRYYESIGLLPRARRRTSGHRVYDAKTAELLIFIRTCRNFGFSVEQVRALVALSTSKDSDCVEMRDIAQTHLDALRARLTEMHALERSLKRFVESCNASCAGGPAPKCSILQDIGRAAEALRGAQSCC